MLLLSEHAFSARLGSWLAACIFNMRAGNPKDSIDEIVRADWGVNFRSVFYPATNTLPALYMADQLGVGLVLVDGANSREQARLLLEGWKHPTPPDTAPVLRNPYTEQLGAELLQRFVNSQINSSQLLVLAGWSLGGAAAMVAARNWQALTFSLYPCKIVTFGQPRTLCGSDQAFIRTNAETCRWMQSADVIPLLPPRFGECPPIALAFTGTEIRNFGYFGHPQFGMSITDAPSQFPQMLPGSASANFATSFLTYVWDYWNDNANVHHIGNYQQTLSRLSQQTAPPPALPVAVPEPDAVIPVQQISRAETVARTTILNLERTQNGVQVVVPPERLCVAYKYNRIWYVRFGDVTICCPGTRRRARNVARQLNDFLRNIQSVAVVDASAIVDQLTNYLDAAGIPNAGFSPTMNTKLE